MQISVIICTHNPREDYLRRTLDALEQQTLPKDQWELLLIDNASHEPLAGRWDLTWHPRFRHIREDELGLTPARLRGIKESSADLLVFVDDDNVLVPSYLLDALRISEEHPMIWVFGAGNINPEFEVVPSKELGPWINGVGVKKIEKATWGNSARRESHFPIGAGLVVRRRGAHHYMNCVKDSSLGRNLDRKGDSLYSSGDIHLISSVVELGYGSGCFPELALIHLIPARRVQRDYLVELHEGFSYSDSILAYIRSGEIPESFQKPTIRSLFVSALRMSVSTALFQASWLWNDRRKSRLEKDFRDAVIRGKALAVKTILNSDRRVP